MKELGLDSHIIFDVYCKEIRSILELAVPVWHSGLTIKQSRDIESIQHLAFSIIVGNGVSYRQKCIMLGADRLDMRRKSLSLNYIRKVSESGVMSDIIIENDKAYDLRPGRQKYREIQCTTKRAYLSPICTLIRQLNDYHFLRKGNKYNL